MLVNNQNNMIAGAVILTYNPDIEELYTLIKKIQLSVKSTIIVDNLSNNAVSLRQPVNSLSNTFMNELNENKGLEFIGVPYTNNKSNEVSGKVFKIWICFFI